MKVSYDAEDKKKGMSLEELKLLVDRATGLAQANESSPADSKVTVLVNISGGIKQLIAEV
jgi:hypothetical protein